MLTEATPVKVSKKALRSRPKIAPESNDSVDYWIAQFTGQYRERFAEFMERGAVYKTLIEGILTRNGVPAELYYLAMIESGFIHNASSKVRAVGIWQFMRPTGRLYGLRADHEVDERMDPIRSTEAAARCLRDLHRQFGSWYLAMAAYNAGPGRVRKAIRTGHSRNFWTLVDRGALPHETSQYVPQFQAAMAIAKNPEAYGFKRHVELKYPTVRKVQVASRVSLEKIAKQKGLSLEALRAVNPHIRGEKTPTGRRTYTLWVPVMSRLATRS